MLPLFDFQARRRVEQAIEEGDARQDRCSCNLK